jgi:hypothetical protein
VRETADPSDAAHVVAVRAFPGRGHLGKTRYVPAGRGGERANYPKKLIPEVGANKLPNVGLIQPKWIVGMAYRGWKFDNAGRCWPSDEYQSNCVCANCNGTRTVHFCKCDVARMGDDHRTEALKRALELYKKETAVSGVFFAGCAALENSNLQGTDAARPTPAIAAVASANRSANRAQRRAGAGGPNTRPYTGAYAYSVPPVYNTTEKYYSVPSEDSYSPFDDPRSQPLSYRYDAPSPGTPRGLPSMRHRDTTPSHGRDRWSATSTTRARSSTRAATTTCGTREPTRTLLTDPLARDGGIRRGRIHAPSSGYTATPPPRTLTHRCGYTATPPPRTLTYRCGYTATSPPRTPTHPQR